MPNNIAPGPKLGIQNGLSIQRATRCASRFPNWKMGSTLQGLLSQLLNKLPPMPRQLSAQRKKIGIRKASVCQTSAKRRLHEMLSNATI